MEVSLNCPSCKREIEFTWGRYFKSPFGRFNCIDCGAKYKLDRPRIYFLRAVVFYVFYFALLAAGIYLFGDQHILSIYLIGTAIYFAVVFPVDKKIESKYDTKLR